MQCGVRVGGEGRLSREASREKWDQMTWPQWTQAVLLSLFCFVLFSCTGKERKCCSRRIKVMFINMREIASCIVQWKKRREIKWKVGPDTGVGWGQWEGCGARVAAAGLGLKELISWSWKEGGREEEGGKQDGEEVEREERRDKIF